METPDPAGAASAALNTTARPVQKPSSPPVNPATPPQLETNQQVNSANGLASTQQVNEGSRIGSIIDTTA